ncbi:MAG: hypothetical protein ACTHMQ_02780 [Protaetiibacter sp.]
MAISLRSVIPVWIGALLGAVAVGIFALPGTLTWIPVVMAAAVLLTFAIQLSLARKEGLVERIMASLGGALIVLVVATGVLVGIGLSTSTTIEAPCACTTVGDAR